MLNIIVCMKQVIDPEAPLSSFRIDPQVKRAIPPQGIPPVLNPFDENALEAALRIKDSQSAKITVLSMGQRLARPVLRRTLATGADELVLLEDDRFDSFDSYFTARVLVKGIKRLGNFDLIFCGREAADSDSGQVGIGIAELLGIPSVTIARKVEVIDGKTRVERVLPDGYEVVEAEMPALITASNEVGELRTPTVTDLILAQRRPVTVWKGQDVRFNPPQPRTSMLRLSLPSRNGIHEVIRDANPEAAGAALALKLREAGII